MPFVDVVLVVKIIGWVLLAGPVLAVLSVSVWLVIGTSNDDPMLKGLMSLGGALMLLGGAMLALAYFTPFLARIAA